MRILMLVNWGVHYLSEDCPEYQAPDKYLDGEKYWLFKYWPPEYEVDVIDYTKVIPFFAFERKLLKLYILQAIRGFVKMKNFDLIISHGAQSGLALSFLRRILGKNVPPHFIIDIGCFNGGRENLLELLPVKYSVRSLAGVIYHASIQENYYQKNLPFLKRKFVPFGVDIDFFAPMNLRSENYIISIGYAKRDYETLLEAWAEIESHKPMLKIIGVKKLDNIKHLPSQVELINQVPVHEYRNLIGRSQFVVLPLPYFKYAYGQMTLLQSMAMGKAVIVTKTPSTVDYVCDKQDALFVEPGETQDIKSKIEMLLHNHSLADSLGKKAHLKIINNFTEKIMAQKIYKFVVETIESGSANNQ